MSSIHSACVFGFSERRSHYWDIGGHAVIGADPSRDAVEITGKSRKPRLAQKPLIFNRFRYPTSTVSRSVFFWLIQVNSWFCQKFYCAS